MAEQPGGHTVIAVLTYRRPQDIVLALTALAEQVERVGEPVHILVVDNDPQGSAGQTVQPFLGPFIHYVHEPKPGIAAARNRAMAESAAAAVLIFFDDDEVPSEHWLSHLLATHRLTRPAGVVGPVISEFAHEPDEWLRGGRFFDRRRMPTGSVVQAAATNNLLLDLVQLRSLDISFDERYGLSGGSDTLFTRQIVRAGGRLVWCDEAVVVDRVPAERMSRRWVLQRAFRSGNSWSRTDVELSRGPGRVLARIRSALVGLVRVGGGAAQAAVGLVTGDVAHRARGTRTFARGAGLVAGGFGHVYSEYRRDRRPRAGAKK